ncbi:helix-turn-helix domain-containing protein [Occultella glacieicola]|uniref:Helix-turn-helix domain-containing protein n=1 Tax=Occultella glacieicola TaxID=2518684 RepID=A0ABY2E837_9MICO|nr:DJ-1/PfpI family protein [Occultella glacieicola]TDE97480.1 helix-turn-helix domain-containing protein [Occultella glacieicola]
MAALSVVVVGFEGAELVDISSVTSTLAVANRLGARPAYRAELATIDGRDIVCDSGLRLGAQRALADVSTVDTLIVSGGLGHEAASRSPNLIQHVRRLAVRARRVASVCTGTSVLAAAGLLDGRRATTHWFYAAEIAERFPRVRLDPAPIYVRDGKVATSGGVTASLDLTLAFVEEDHGAEFARWVAMGMVTYLQRPGNQAQMSIFTAAPRADDAVVKRVLDHATAHPDGDLRAATLAGLVGVSTRQLTRLFQERLGLPPASAVRRIRLELAARLVSTTELSMSQIAGRCGFGSAESLRQAFVNRYGASPRSMRGTHARSLTGS